jgi:hypothetical protein
MENAKEGDALLREIWRMQERRDRKVARLGFMLRN